MTYRAPLSHLRATAGTMVLIAVWLVGGRLRVAETYADEPDQSLEVCVLPLGDLTGDGVSDYAVSGRSAARDAAPLAYLIVGGTQPLPQVLDNAFLRARMFAVLRGVAAVPFTCSQEVVPPAGSAAKITRRGDIRGRVRLPRQSIDSPIGQPVFYTQTDLTPSSAGGYLVASAINAAGVVIGRALTAQGFEHAFVYEGSELRSLGTLGGHFSDATAVNDFGAIVGYSLTGETDQWGFVQAAFLSDSVLMQSLELPWSTADGINNLGHIVGSFRIDPDADEHHAFLFENGYVIDLGALPPLGNSVGAFGLSINDAGQVVGQSNTFTFGVANPAIQHHAVHGFLYENGSMRDLGSFGPLCRTLNPALGAGVDLREICFERSSAIDINNKGQIVGFSSSPTSPARAFLITDDGMEDLGTLGGTQSWAYATNDSGQIVGSSLTDEEPEQYRPFLYDRGAMYDLHDLIVNGSDAPLPFAAYDINNFGQIVGNHHLLNPSYLSIAPRRGLSFKAVLGRTLSFAYWVSREQPSNCRRRLSRLVIHVGIDTAKHHQAWTSGSGPLAGCESSADWETASIQIPQQFHGEAAAIHIRAGELGPRAGSTIYLRHFSMD